MPAYVLAQTDVHDAERYERYKAASPGAITAAGGRFIVGGGEVVVLEGDWRPKRLVLLEFEDVDAAKRWLRLTQVPGGETPARGRRDPAHGRGRGSVDRAGVETAGNATGYVNARMSALPRRRNKGFVGVLRAARPHASLLPGGRCDSQQIGAVASLGCGNFAAAQVPGGGQSTAALEALGAAVELALAEHGSMAAAWRRASSWPPWSVARTRRMKS
jgi:uncharacterized protein (DUF1330 family)